MESLESEAARKRMKPDVFYFRLSIFFVIFSSVPLQSHVLFCVVAFKNNNNNNNKQVEEKEGDEAEAQIVEKEESETNIAGSEEMELNISHIFEKIENFTQRVAIVVMH